MNEQILTVESANGLDADWIAENVDHEQAVVWWEHPVSRHYDGSQYVGEIPPLGTWRCDPDLGEYEVLVDIPVKDCPPSESDWHNALKWESTRNYVTWLLRGSEPPPISVVEHIDGDLVSNNRRRWLAAREVGHRLIKAWYSPTALGGRSQFWLPEMSSVARAKLKIVTDHGRPLSECFSKYEMERLGCLPSAIPLT